MLKFEKRVLTLPEKLAVVQSGQLVPTIYEVDETVAGPETRWEPGVALLNYRLKRCKMKRRSPLSKRASEEREPAPVFEPNGVASHSWVEEMLQRGAVLAALPNNSQRMALSEHMLCGSSDFWLDGMLAASANFNETKTRRSQCGNKTTFECNAFFDSLPSFLPQGDAYGLQPADTDSLVDAGVCVEVRMLPYGVHERIGSTSAAKRATLCARELATTLDAARLGTGPAMFAAFYTGPAVGRTPQLREDVEALITVSQLHTFTLDSLMEAFVKAPVLSRREHLTGVLSGACSSVFDRLRKLLAPAKGQSVIKLNMTPSSIVFCPRLQDNDGMWTVKGVGFMPVSRDYLDGEPLFTDFNSMLTSTVPESAHSPDVSFMLHALLLVAYTRARHGPEVSGVMWNYLQTHGDPSGFVGASNRVKSKQTNASAFLANLAANSEMREDHDLSRAVAELVSDVDALVRVGVFSDDGGFAQPAHKPVFSKLIGVVTGLRTPDTRIFERLESESAVSADLETYYALQNVKAARSERLRRNSSACCP